MKKVKILLTASSGGHYTELQQLSFLIEKYECVCLTEKTAVVKPMACKMYYVPRGSKSEGVKYLFKFAYVWLKSLMILIKENPTHIISTGVHSTVPSIMLGKLFGKKVIYIETIANVKTKSVSGKLMYRFTDLFIVQWEDLLEVYDDATYGGVIF